MKKKMDLSKDSPEIAQNKLESFKKLFPEAISEGKIDVEALRRTIGESVAATDERYTMNWSGKTEAFKALQTSTTATLAPCQEESIDFEKTGNIFIEGENLEVLKVLQKAYYGKIKMIYLDPPYNTGSDSFIYPDRFQESKEEYLKRIEEKDEEGYLLKEGLFRKNSKESGHYHSNWMSMMYPRIFLARNLLRDDGVIFISIDDNEVSNLRKICDEIFGEDSQVGIFSWKNKYGAGAKTKGLIEVHEYVLCYSKTNLLDIEAELTKEQIDEYDKKRDEKYAVRGGYITQPLMTKSLDDRANLRYTITYNGDVITPRKQWVWEQKRLLKAIDSNDIVFKKKKNGEYSVRAKVYLKDEHGNIRKGKPISSLNGPFNQEGTEEVAELLGEDIFSFPKPKKLIQYFVSFILNNTEDKNGIYLDFFSGSATTAHAVLDLNKHDTGNRRFILVQLPEPCAPTSEALKSGYKTIAEIGKERIRRVIKKLKKECKESADLFSKSKSEPDFGFKVFKLKNSNFKIWRGDVVDTNEDLEKQLDMLKDPVKPEALEENLLWELILKSGYDLNTPIEEQKAGKCKFYVVAGGEMAVIVSTADAKCLQAIIQRKPQKVVCLDSVFEGNDQLKTNTLLQMKDAEIEFRTI